MRLVSAGAARSGQTASWSTASSAITRRVWCVGRSKAPSWKRRRDGAVRPPATGAESSEGSSSATIARRRPAESVAGRRYITSATWVTRRRRRGQRRGRHDHLQLRRPATSTARDRRWRLSGQRQHADRAGDDRCPGTSTGAGSVVNRDVAADRTWWAYRPVRVALAEQDRAIVGRVAGWWRKSWRPPLAAKLAGAGAAAPI